MRRLVLLTFVCSTILFALLATAVWMPFASRAQQPKVITDCSSDAALREAIEDAPESVWYYPIRFDCGAATIHLSAPLSVTRQVQIEGSGVITLSGGNTTHHFDIGALIYVEIAGVTLVEGYAINSTSAITPVAGSIVNRGALALKDVTIADSRATGPLSAGAIANLGSLSGEGVRFLNLEGESAGAIYDLGGTSITTAEFVGNRGGESGVIVTLGSSGFGDSIFRGNVGVNGSGVMTLKVTENPPPEVYPRSWGTISRSSLIENEGGECAAILSDNGNLHITSSTVASNTTTSGGVICVKGQRAESVNIENSTISGNHSVEATLSFSGYNWLSLWNVTVANNHVDNALGVILSTTKETHVAGRNNILVATGAQACLMRNPGNQGFASSILPDASCNTPSPYQNFSREPLSIVADPLLGPLADNGGTTLTHLPLPASPARSIGAYCWESDQRGVIRWPGSCDAGSVEVAQRPVQARLPVILHQNWPAPTPTFTPQP